MDSGSRENSHMSSWTGGEFGVNSQMGVDSGADSGARAGSDADLEAGIGSILNSGSTSGVGAITGLYSEAGAHNRLWSGAVAGLMGINLRTGTNLEIGMNNEDKRLGRSSEVCATKFAGVWRTEVIGVITEW